MAISFTGNPGGMFKRLGLLLGGVNEMNTFMQTTQGNRLSAIFAQYTTNEQDVVSDITSQLDNLRRSPLGWLSMLQQDAVQTVIEQTNRDVPLTNLTLRDALVEVISQMVTQTATLTRPTVSITGTVISGGYSIAAGASNYGSTVLLATLKDVDGLTKYLVFPETLTATVTSDAGRGATAYAEPISVVGLPTVDPLSPLWPGGSGSSTGFSIQDNFVDNIITNGSFNNWNPSGTSIDNWVITTCGGTSIISRTSDPVRGTYCLRFTGDGSSSPCLYQILPAGALLPNTVYAIQYWAKQGGTAASNGTLRIRMTDEIGNTISDDAGTTNLFSVAATSLTGSYTSRAAFFVTPKVLPPEVRIYIDFTGTALTSGTTLNVSLLGMQATTPLYQGGPNVAAFSGVTQAAINDTWDIEVNNNGGTTNFLTALERFFSTRTLGLKFNSAASGSISDSLIV